MSYILLPEVGSRKTPPCLDNYVKFCRENITVFSHLDLMMDNSTRNHHSGAAGWRTISDAYWLWGRKLSSPGTSPGVFTHHEKLFSWRIFFRKRTVIRVRGIEVLSCSPVHIYIRHLAAIEHRNRILWCWNKRLTSWLSTSAGTTLPMCWYFQIPYVWTRMINMRFWVAGDKSYHQAPTSDKNLSFLRIWALHFRHCH